MKARECIESIKTEARVELSCLVYLPDDYGTVKGKKWPAILYLHGRDERGTDLSVLANAGLPKYLEKNSVPFVVIAPLCPSGTEWIFLLDALAVLVKELPEKYDVDGSGISLTGNSMGGIGSWHLGIKYPELFASVLPVCGGVYPFLGFPEEVVRLKNVPVWVFHGLDDDVLPVQFSKALVDILAEAGGNIRYTFYENTGHDSWTRTYADREIYDWMLRQPIKQR